jgi:hypothetical protein
MKNIDQPKKIHVKHIIPGFLYCRTKSPTDHFIVTQILPNAQHCEIFKVQEGIYSWAVRQAIVIGIRNGTLLSLMGQKYR